MPEKGNEGDGLSAGLGRPADDSAEEMTGPLSDGDGTQEEDDAERVAALLSHALETLNLDGVTMATLQAVGKRAGCTADFSRKSKQTAPSLLVDHREAEENAATAAREVGAGVYQKLLLVGDTMLLPGQQRQRGHTRRLAHWGAAAARRSGRPGDDGRRRTRARNTRFQK